MTAARNCELLGVCQHPERECPGTCQQAPRLPAWEPPEPGAALARFSDDDAEFTSAMLVLRWFAFACGALIALVVCCMAAGFAWAKWLSL